MGEGAEDSGKLGQYSRVQRGIGCGETEDHFAKRISQEGAQSCQGHRPAPRRAGPRPPAARGGARHSAGGRGSGSGSPGTPLTKLCESTGAREAWCPSTNGPESACFFHSRLSGAGSLRMAESRASRDLSENLQGELTPGHAFLHSAPEPWRSEPVISRDTWAESPAHLL